MMTGQKPGLRRLAATLLATAASAFAMGSAQAAYPDEFVILDFSGTDGDFQFTEEERAENVNIGVSLMKGSDELREAIDSVLSEMTVEDFNDLMAYAISIQE